MSFVVLFSCLRDEGRSNELTSRGRSAGGRRRAGRSWRRKLRDGFTAVAGHALHAGDVSRRLAFDVGGEGVVGGYHCWAWMLPDGKGWMPVDISEANQHPELQEYYFGNLSEDRVMFTTGRDIDLVPQQKGPALNFFIYPYAEVDGQPLPGDQIQRIFSYQDVK